MIEELNFTRLESVCWRALCRHQVSEREMTIAGTKRLVDEYARRGSREEAA